MASEYDIYRAYAGMNESKSNLEIFMQGLKDVQAGARADRQLDLQERSQDRADEVVEFNKQKAIVDTTRQEKLDEDNEFKMMLQYAQNPAQRAMIARARGKEELALGFDKQAKDLEDANNIYKKMYSGSEEEMLSASTEMLSKIPINSHTEGMHKVAAQRQNAMFESIKDDDEEILSSKYATEYAGYIKTLNDPLASEAKKKEDQGKIIDIRNKYRKDQQDYYRARTKMSTSTPQVDKDINEELGDYIINDNVGSSLIAGNFLGEEQPSFPVYADELEKQRVTSPYEPKETDLAKKEEKAKPLDKDYFVKDKSGLENIVEAYKGKGELGFLEKSSKEGSYMVPASQDAYKAIKGGVDQLRDRSSALYTLDKPNNLSKEEFDVKYKEESDVFKKSLQDMYALYLRLDPKGTEGVDSIKRAGGVKRKKYGGNQALRKMLSQELKKHKKVAKRGKYNYYKHDPEINEILDSIQL